MGIVAGAIVCIAGAGCAGTDPCPLDAEPWNANIGWFDHIDRLTLAAGGEGEWLHGGAQRIEAHRKFQWLIVNRESLELRNFVEVWEDGSEHPYDWPPRTVGYAQRRGHFCFDVPYDSVQCYACELKTTPRLDSAAGRYYSRRVE